MFDVILVGILLIISGFAIVAFSVLSASGRAKGEVRGAGIVMIGPIPIVFGSDAKWVGIVIGLVIVLVSYPWLKPMGFPSVGRTRGTA